MVEIKVDKSERKKLKVTWAKPEIETFGKYGKRKVFNCDDGVQYECNKASLHDAIQVNADIDADTESQTIIFDDGGQKPQSKVY